MPIQLPAYPVVHVNLQADGSAHLNVAGRHIDYPPAELEDSRAAIIAYAVDVAIRLGRGVRMTTTDPNGEWKLGVFPDGEVVDLDPAAAKGRGTSPRLPPAAAPAAAPAIVVVDALPLPAPPAVPPSLRQPQLQHDTVLISPAPRVAASPAASLTFSTGDVVTIGAPAIIGRKPQASAADSPDAQFITLSDPERCLSRTHADVGWVGTKLILTDRGAGNGTYVTRAAAKVELQRGEPYELRTGDLVHLGTTVTCTVVTTNPALGGRQ